MNYYKYAFTTAAEKTDILLALLGDLPFESFQDSEQGLEAFVQEQAAAQITPAALDTICLLYTSPSPRDGLLSRMPSSA